MASLYLPSSSSSHITTNPNTATQQPSHHLESYGSHCSHPPCHQLDFLPLQCPSCHLPFCTSHFSPLSHSCSSPLPSALIDRRVPSCPLCSAPCPISPHLEGTADADAGVNEAVERHLLSGRCEKLDLGEDGLVKDGGAVKKRRAAAGSGSGTGGGCGRKGCKEKVLKGTGFSCPHCAREHCARHRMPIDHSCTSYTPTPTPTAASKPKSKPKPVAAPAPKQDKPQPKSSVVKTLLTNIKDDSRARAEEESRRRALKARQDKGLLTEAEKMELATRAAIQVREGKVGKKGKKGGKEKGKGDCVIA